MCVGIPMQITQSDGMRGEAFDGERAHVLDLALTGPLAPGTWVLTFLGAAREVLEEDEALKIRAAVQALSDIMNGTGDGADAFADIEARGPQLPPHLQAAAAAGKTTA